MATSIALGANIGTTVSGGSAGTTYQFAPGTYYGQTFSPKAGDVYFGDPTGLTKLSGAWVVTSWSGSGSTYKATQGLSDLNGTTQTNFPTGDSITNSITGYISGTTLTVSTTVRGAVAGGSTIWDGAGLTSARTTITGGSGSTWTVSNSQTVGSSGSPVTFYLTASNGVDTSQFPMANFSEDLYVNDTRYTRIAAPGPAGANTWWLNPSDNSVNVNSNLGASTATGSACTIAGTVLTVGGTVTGTWTTGSVIAGSGITVGTQIIAYGTGGGGAGTYVINKSHTISSEAMTQQALVEFSAMNTAVAGDNSNVTTWHNITMDKWSVQTVGGYAAVRNVDNWNFYNCVFSNIHGTGVYCNHTLFQNCKFINMGCDSVGSYQGINIKLIDCELTGCGWAGFSVNWSAAAVKLFGYDCSVIGCHIHDNFCHGVWFDGESGGITIANNRIYNNTAVSQGGFAQGIYYEVSKGNTRIANNYVANNNGGGIIVANSNGVEIYGNTVVVGSGNSGDNAGGINCTNYSRGSDSANFRYELRNVNVHDNVIIHVNDTAYDGILIAQALTNPNLTFNNNIFITPNTTGSFFRFDSNAAVSHSYTWAQLQTAGIYETTGQNLVGSTATSLTNLMASPGDWRKLLLTMLASPIGIKAPILG